MLEVYNNRKEKKSKVEAMKFEKAYEGSKYPNMTFFANSDMSTILKNFLKLTIMPC